jgi:hypothetical protein
MTGIPNRPRRDLITTLVQPPLPKQILKREHSYRQLRPTTPNQSGGTVICFRISNPTGMLPYRPGRAPLTLDGFLRFFPVCIRPQKCHELGLFLPLKISPCIINFHGVKNKRKDAVQRNALISCHTLLHVSDRMNHYQVLLLTIIKKHKRTHFSGVLWWKPYFRLCFNAEPHHTSLPSVGVKQTQVYAAVAFRIQTHTLPDCIAMTVV